MTDLYWILLVVLTSGSWYGLGYSRGKLSEIRERIRQREEWHQISIELLREHENFVREIAKHLNIDLPPRLKVVPPAETR